MSEHAPVVEMPRSLAEGERLDQPTFHERYAEVSASGRAELISGVVHLPGPISRAHALIHVPTVVWLSYYAEHTPGVEVLDNPTTVLGWRCQLQPDAVLRILPECGGRTRAEGGFVRGAPELIVEVAKASRYVDLGPKLTDYEHAGVLEYIVPALGPDEILWFEQEQGTLALMPTGDDGLHRSTAFPGLWLDPKALLEGNTRRLRVVLDRGLASRPHAEFVARLAAARKASERSSS